MRDEQAAVVTDVRVCVTQGSGVDGKESCESNAGVVQHKARWFVVCE